MKKLLAFAALFAVVALTSCKYDDDDLWNSVHGLENRVAKLEELCKQMNTNISSLQTIVTALQNNVYVTGTTPLMKDGKEIGYTITFSKGNPITIYHGKDGQDGEDGITPTISVKKDTDGVYYWTLNGEFIVVDGGKIQAEGKDGTNGTTPQFKIENDYWFVSYDNGANWTQLGKATGEDGIGGDSMFSGVDYETSTDYVIFTLSNGTQIKLPTWSAFEALQRLCNETNTNLSALQTIVTALQNNDYITSVDPLTENGKVVGYTIKFAKSNPIVIYNGKDGADGVNGNTPVIGVKKDTDGIYYWTLDGEFIVVDGQKIKAQGTDGNNGADGSDGVTPKLEIREGYWWISYDNGVNWTQLGKATGEDGKDADSIIITQDENNVYFELADGTVITISKTGQSTPNIIEFKDPYVKTICVAAWDTDGDSELSYVEATAITTLGTKFKGNTLIESFEELKYFTHLTSIDDDTFNACTALTSIQIPASVETIGLRAFKSCSSLANITFEKGSILRDIKGGSKMASDYMSIDYYGAFSDCSALTAIEIPASVESIGVAAFPAVFITIEQPKLIRNIRV
ncbi:PL29 family lyase N-terminal domain-containing protein [Alistipes finegoldii]|uniref:PL29 family lyase N-terminal domain-containing protein n=1 Tax=Alistipes finegoldii TaxID=214856 RepID=UPI00399627E6